LSPVPSYLRPSVPVLNVGTNGRIVRPREAEGRCVPFNIDCLDSSSPSRNTRLEEEALAAAAQVHTLATATLDETTNATALVDSATFADGSLAPESSKSAVAKVKKKGKPKLTQKEKKERSVRIYIVPSSSRGGAHSYRVVLHEDGD
jgi:hypothetical protein